MFWILLALSEVSEELCNRRLVLVQGEDVSDLLLKDALWVDRGTRVRISVSAARSLKTIAHLLPSHWTVYLSVVLTFSVDPVPPPTSISIWDTSSMSLCCSDILC